MERFRPARLEALATVGEAPRSRGGEGRGLTCFLTTLHPERALSLALVQHLSHEMPDIEFTLEDRPLADAVWICGYEGGEPRLVRELRERHPASVLIVTGRGTSESWEEEVLGAGADHACPWPLAIDHLDRILHRQLARRLA